MKEIFFDILEINIAVTPVIILLGLLAEKIRRRYGAVWMKALWLILIFRLLIPYNFSLSLAGIPVMEFPAGEPPRAVAELFGRPVLGNEWSDVKGDAAQEILIDRRERGNYGTAARDIEGHFAETDQKPKESDFEKGGKQSVTSQALLEKISSPASDTGEEQGEDRIGDGLAIIWAAGCFLFLLYYLTGYLIFELKCRKNLRPLSDKELKKSICSLQRDYLGKRTLPVCLCRGISSPMITGVIWPKLVLPPGKRDWTTKELALVLSHEMYHYKHRDLWLKILMLLAGSLNWINPAVYFLKRRFFFEIELACDSAILRGRNEDMRERYARVMLSFAGGRGRAEIFSTGFGVNKKHIKKRIDCMMDMTEKKRGFTVFLPICFLMTALGLMVSCGSPEEKRDTQENTVEPSAGEAMEKEESSGNRQEEPVSFDYNNEYNEMIRCHGDYTYIGREDGIYRRREGSDEETLVYANQYELRRGMELYGDFLYFCGSAMRGTDQKATVYRMDLGTLEVEDALALFSQTYEGLYGISVYEGNLYVAQGDLGRIGFSLDEEGRINKSLDETADDFLYREYNEYMELQNELRSTKLSDSGLPERLNERYQALIDVAACRKLLGGNWIVSRYKDEAQRSFYLEKPDGTNEFLFDSVGYPVLVTESEFYYPAKEAGDIWRMNYESRETEAFLQRASREWEEILLVNYDADYIYYTKERYIGRDQNGDSVLEAYLMRMPRQGGQSEKVFRIEGDLNAFQVQNSSSIDKEYMYFRTAQRKSLDPAQNGMERENSGQPSGDAVKMRRVMEEFASAYFSGDSDTMAGLLENGEEGAEAFPYPEAADSIVGTYISGLPEGELEEGVICYVSYEFTGNPEVEEGIFCYLTVEMKKTENEWRIISYGIEM